VAASSFRFAVGRTLGWNTLRSDRYEVSEAGARLTFRGAGEGHGVGLCQRGADQMGREGMGYHDILAFYFPGTAPGMTGRGLAWVRTGGEAVALFSTQPEQDRAVLAIAERQLKDIAGETGWAAPGPVEIRVYPDVETFRNATGEPGWVAAHTSGRRVELQPAGVLRGKGVLESTLRHELLHVVVEGQAKAGLPVWFREGVVGYLERRHGGGADLSEGDLRQTEDEARARRAYAAAAQRVTELVHRNGAATVLEWVRTGMPKE